jgi:hypothetical protein
MSIRPDGTSLKLLQIGPILEWVNNAYFTEEAASSPLYERVRAA